MTAEPTPRTEAVLRAARRARGHRCRRLCPGERSYRHAQAGRGGRRLGGRRRPLCRLGSGDRAQPLRAISRASIHVKLFGGDGISLTGFLEELGDAELDTYVTAPMLPAGNYAISGESFFETFRERHGGDAEPMSIFGYEAGDAVMDSIRAGVRGDIATQPISTLRNDTRDAFFSISERSSALGSYSIDANGDTTLTFYGAYRVEGGALVLGRAIDVPGSLLQEVE